MDKRLSAADAVAQISDGMTIGMGGWGPRRKPMALVREILRSDLKDLTIVAYGGADVGMLCASGKVKKVIFAFVSLDFIPLEPYFRQARQNGAVEVMEIDEGMLLLGLRAAAWGMPYIPTEVGLGTDVITHNPEIKVIDSPYDDKEWVAMPAIKLDVALIHADRADARGVCQIEGPDHYLDDWFVRAADTTIVSCEEIVDTDYFHDPIRARQVFWERSETTTVVEIPGGAHPSSCNPQYGFDVPHFKTYVASAKEEGGFAAYCEKFLGKDEAEYQERVGGLDAIRNIALPIY
ncbi:CoA transferase subunit A [Parahaliea sp. F7430]|uniref:CoA transferase subunit A n=1 Tax=Sediminihaliea albiluteola TaxID=2758564 RepID=A0A7W2TYG0_9GAMM|nr:CoA transferase subunit A [Sediminihaliea albiluteola]MBA6414252.1 CoA transferase subunit A [Sediminihaliea albiluteola]